MPLGFDPGHLVPRCRQASTSPRPRSASRRKGGTVQAPPRWPWGGTVSGGVPAGWPWHSHLPRTPAWPPPITVQKAGPGKPRGPGDPGLQEAARRIPAGSLQDGCPGGGRRAPLAGGMPCRGSPALERGLLLLGRPGTAAPCAAGEGRGPRRCGVGNRSAASRESRRAPPAQSQQNQPCAGQRLGGAFWKGPGSRRSVSLLSRLQHSPAAPGALSRPHLPAQWLACPGGRARRRCRGRVGKRR